MGKPTRLIASLVTALGLAALVAPGTATAASTAYNQKFQFLTAKPTEGLPESCVQNNRMYLQKDHYEWGQRMNNSRQVPRPGMYLETAYYRWTDCLKPMNGYYIHTSTLDPEPAGWDTATMSGEWRLTVNGNYTWGGFLDPHH